MAASVLLSKKQTSEIGGEENKGVIRQGWDESALGVITIAWGDQGICWLGIDEGIETGGPLARSERVVEDVEGAAPLLRRINAWLDRGENCEDLALDLRGTDFQRKIWAALRAIPEGTTTTYGGLAKTLGLPATSSRAIGTACGSNPVSLLVPCHRVLRGDGALGGYRWGLERKQMLLDIERRRTTRFP